MLADSQTAPLPVYEMKAMKVSDVTSILTRSIQKKLAEVFIEFTFNVRVLQMFASEYLLRSLQVCTCAWLMCRSFLAASFIKISKAAPTQPYMRAHIRANSPVRLLMTSTIVDGK